MTLKNKRLKINRQKGESLTSTLFTLVLFSVLALSFQRWASAEARLGQKIYQQRQMLQIAKNQKVRQRLGLPCEKTATPNGITFSIQCTNGKIVLRGSMATLTFR